MGFWKARSVDVGELGKGFLDVLGAEEEAVQAFKFRRDLIVFTDRRLILVDRQGLPGRKAEYHSIPYRAITHFSVVSAGFGDLDADLKIWVSGSDKPIEKDLYSAVDTNVDTKLLLRTMAEFIL